MADAHPDTPLLLTEFPPVPTSDWEAQIAKDLKGADYARRLIWRTDEGIAVRPYYRSDDAPVRDPLFPGPRSWRLVRVGEEPPLDASALEIHEAGGTAVHEVGAVLAQGADALAEGRRVACLGFAMGSNHFMEIAKLRAVRLLWPQVRAAFGLDDTPVLIHARTASENKTLFDPYVNLLRVTTEAVSAILGGCDLLTITPCGFDAHLADNVHHILREESHLDKVADPGAGSYYVEALTDALAIEAWRLFQSIEAAGGWAVYRASGTLDTALARAREDKAHAVAARRRVLVGTNNYPDPEERRLAQAGQVPAGWRLASAFEQIRLRTERHAVATGRTPRVLLLERGDLKMRKARAAFCRNLFLCAGFEIVQSETLGPADLIVLCSADAEYPAFAGDVCPRVTTPVVVAGNPRDQVEALRALGVSDFVHVASDAVATLTAWQARLGIND